MTLFCCLFIVWSCDKEANSYTLSDEKLVNIMADIHISEAAATQLTLAVKDSMNEIYLEQILAIYEVPKDEFENNFEKLSKDPEKLVLVYDQIITRLGELKSKKEEEEAERNEQNQKKR